MVRVTLSGSVKNETSCALLPKTRYISLCVRSAPRFMKSDTWSGSGCGIGSFFSSLSTPTGRSNSPAGIAEAVSL